MKHIIGILCFVVVMPLLAQGKVDPANGVERDFGKDRFAAGKLFIVSDL